MMMEEWTLLPLRTAVTRGTKSQSTALCVLYVPGVGRANVRILARSIAIPTLNSGRTWRLMTSLWKDDVSGKVQRLPPLANPGGFPPNLTAMRLSTLLPQVRCRRTVLRKKGSENRERRGNSPRLVAVRVSVSCAYVVLAAGFQPALLTCPLLSFFC